MLRQIFLEHPKSMGETYLGHQREAFGIGLSMIAGGLACVMHGLVPAMFLTTGGDMISTLHRRITARRAAAGNPGVLASPRGAASDVRA